MLKQRVITALVLLAILLPALLHPNTLGFNAIVLVMVSAGAWEWGRLNLVGPVATWASVAGVAAVAGLAWQQGWLAASYPLLWWAVGGAWVLAASFLVRHGVPVWARIALWLRWPLGLLALLAAGLAMVQARGMGINFLLSVLLLVWMADIAAYFAGRALGQRFIKVKLAPSISPGKSWEGALGGAVGVMLMAVLWVQCDAQLQPDSLSLFSHLAQGGWALLVLATLFLTAMSVLGDLVESLIKRSAGSKTAASCCPAMAACSTALMPLSPLCPWP